MSKIFDALRKAESKTSGPSRRKGEVRARQEMGEEVESKFLHGVEENFRRGLMTLRNSIDSELKNSDFKVIMFTSAIAGEGKTTIVAFLARMLALSEADRVLLVDCAVDNPELHKLFGLKNDKGILDYLGGSVLLEDIINEVDGGFLDVVTTGPKRGADITQPLFNSEKMTTFIRATREMYDYVLIDSSAILDAAETPIIGSYATGTIIVVQSGRTKREVIKRAMMTIEKLGGRFLGTVLNRKKYYIPEFIYRRV